jgi:hypothetical protein
VNKTNAITSQIAALENMLFTTLLLETQRVFYACPKKRMM